MLRAWITTLLYISTTLVVIAPASATSPIITDLSQPVDLAPYIEFIEDPSRNLSESALHSTEHAQQWRPNVNPIFKGLEPKTRYWFKVEFEVSLPKDQSAIIYIPMQPGLIGDLLLEQTDSKGNTHRIHTGATNPFQQRDIAFPRFAFELQEHAGKVRLFGYLDNSDLAATAKLPLLLISEKAFEQQRWNLDAITLLFYGAMSALFLYNLCLFLALRQSLYGIYILFLPCAMFTCATIDGSLARWVWPSDMSFDWRIMFINGSLGAMLFMAFVFTALKRVSFWPRFTSTYHALMATGWLCILLSIPFISVAQLSMAYCGIIWVVMMVVLVSAVKKHIPTSGFLLLSETVTLAGATVFMLMMLDILPTNEWTQWSAHIGVAGEALLLSLTLAALTRLAFKERSAAEQTLLSAQKQVIQEHESSQKLKDSFMSTITHELLTPINGIRLSLSLLKPTVNSDGKEFLNMAQNSSINMLNLVESMITFTEARKGSLHLRLNTFNLHKMLESLLDQLKEENKRNISLTLNYSSNLPKWVVSDQKKLAMVVFQLLNNAIAFTREGGISLTCAIHNNDTTQQLTISVKDTGTGITEESQQEIFEAFNQVDSTVSRSHGGMGIGLTLVHDVLNLMGGKLNLKSKPGLGSTFTLNMPISLPTQEKIAEAQTAEQKQLLEEEQKIVFQQGLQGFKKNNSPTSNATVLVVEDNPVNMKLLVKVLEKCQFKTLSAIHGEEALHLLNSNQRVDAVLMDCQMPIMDGYETTRRIRQSNDHRDLPIIAITANVSENDQQRCYDAGMSDYLPKPTSPKHIESVLLHWLHESA